MSDEVSKSDVSEPGRLLRSAADALASRRQLDQEIAQLVDEPLDPTAPDRVRAAQDRAAVANRNLRNATSDFGPPPWRTADDAEPGSRDRDGDAG